MTQLPEIIARARSTVRWRSATTPMPGQPILDRILAKVEVVDECWVWSGKLTRDGYGRIYLPDGRLVGTHRVVFEALVGELTNSDCVCHHCDNPPCCNPAHLFRGTRLDNNRDRHAKGRSVIPDPGDRRGSHQRARTQCPRGHAYDASNTYVTPQGTRKCRACARLLKANRRQLRAA